MSRKRVSVRNGSSENPNIRSLDPVETGAENLTAADAVRATHEDVARRAYDLYEQRGCIHGQCQQNWLQAERELQSANYAN